MTRVGSQRHSKQKVVIYVPTFRDNLLVPSLRVKNSKKLDFLTLEEGVDKLSLRIDNLRCLITQKSADFIYIMAEAWNHARIRPVRVANDPVEFRTRHLLNTSRGHDNFIKSFGGPVLMQRVSNKVAQLISC
jgi:hypothetical protein